MSSNENAADRNTDSHLLGGSMEHQLADWTGGFAPAPVDWDERPPFLKSSLRERIEEWRAGLKDDHNEIFIGSHLASSSKNETPAAWTDTTVNCHGALQFGISNCSAKTCKLGAGMHSYSTLIGEIALSSWIPLAIDGLSAREWWARHKKEPSTHIESAPFWDRYLTYVALQDPGVPDVKVDTSDNDMNKVRRQTAEQSSLTFDNRQLRALNAQRNRNDKLNLAKLPKYNIASASRRAPKVDLFLRPVERRDMSQVAEILNYYIENTVCSAEPYPLSLRSILEKWNDVAEAKLPFLVAVQGSSKDARDRISKQIHKEHIVGFALADEYHDSAGMYRYVVEIEIYVSQPFLRQGVGHCLMDRILAVLDPFWVARGFCDFIGDELAYAPGGKRVVGTVVLNVPYDCKNGLQLEWIGNWLSEFGFQKAGELDEIGRKLNTVVNQAIFMRKTGHKIEAWAMAL